METWTRLLGAGVDSRRVAWTELGDGFVVSTVWLGMNHRFVEEGPPLIFETMILDDECNDFYCERSATEEAALAAHDQAVAWARDVGVSSLGEPVDAETVIAPEE